MSKPEKTPFTLAKITDVKQPVTINDIVYLLTPQAQLESLLKQKKEYQADIAGLKKAVLSILNLIGLLDPETQNIKAKIKSGEEGYQKHILKALKDVTVLLMTSSMSKNAAAQLKQKFEFLTEVLPIVEKYAGDLSVKPDQQKLNEAKVLNISDGK